MIGLDSDMRFLEQPNLKYFLLSRQESNSVLSVVSSGADHRSFRRMSRDEAPT
jgi:hypothetical protein